MAFGMNDERRKRRGKWQKINTLFFFQDLDRKFKQNKKKFQKVSIKIKKSFKKRKPQVKLLIIKIITI